MKTAERILDQIKAGSWEVKHEEGCSCHFNWFLNACDDLVHTVEQGNCWERKTLLVGKKQVVVNDRGNVRICVKGIIDPFKIGRDPWIALYIPARDNRWEWPGNETHNARRREALIKFLLSCGYALDCYYPCNFANEYVMVLREMEKPVTNTRENCEKWADDFLYRGDAATEASVGFRFIPYKVKS